MNRITDKIRKSALTALLVTFASAAAYAHCDTMNGPVVMAAKKALRIGNVNLVLIWVQKTDEAEVAAAFRQARIVRKLSRDARKLADKYFFETVVRLHRAGEGEPYTGLKPTGTKIPPIFAAVDTAIATGSVEELLIKFPANTRADVEELFRKVVANKKFDVNNVKDGRRYVKSYVEFLHHVEHLFGESET